MGHGFCSRNLIFSWLYHSKEMERKIVWSNPPKKSSGLITLQYCTRYEKVWWYPGHRPPNNKLQRFLEKASASKKSSLLSQPRSIIPSQSLANPRQSQPFFTNTTNPLITNMTNTREMAQAFNIFNYSKELRRIVTDLESPLKTRRRERKIKGHSQWITEFKERLIISKTETRSIMASENDICCVCWSLKVRHANSLCTSDCQVRDELITFLFWCKQCTQFFILPWVLLRIL